jgi:hypothetical protein
MPKLVDGYNMLIWEHEDGSVSYTGSFNRSEWDAYLAKSGEVAVASGAEVPPEEPGADESAADLDGETVESLKEKLKERDLPVSGNKAELVERLREADSEES